MQVPDRIRDLFARTKRAPVQSPSVVRHERIDEIVRDDLRAASRQFDAALDHTPRIGLGEGADGSEVNIDYAQAPDLWNDLFYSHYTSGDHVGIKALDEVKPSHALHQRIMEHFVNHDEFLATRSLTRDDDLGSALSTMAAQQTLESELSTTLREHADRARQMSEHEEAMQSHEERLEQLRERVRNGDTSDTTRDLIQDLAQQKREHREALTNLIEEQDASGLGVDAAEAVGDAAEAAHEIADTWVSLPGAGRGERERMAPDQAFDLAVRWKDNHQLRDVLKLVGRMERDFRFQRSNRVQGGREEIVDVELGNDLDLLLPTEAMRLMHPILQLQFFKGYIERSLLQYETVGDSPAGDGPIITCRDISGSMSGQKMVWASAVILAMLSVAQREGRAFANIDFNGVVTGQQFFPRRKAIDPNLVTDIAATSASGGTDITDALQAAKPIIDTHDFRTADIVIVTDGSDTWDDDDLALCTYFKERGIRVHSFVIGPPETYYTNMAADITGGTAVAVTDLAAPSEATRQVVQAIS